MYGIGYISPSVNTLLHKSQKLATLGKLPPMQSAAGNAFDIDYVPISEIYTDEKSFQNRADKYSEKSVNSIINAVNNGAFNWFAFDPVTLWLNPSDGKYYVLSGHSRTQAFRQLSKQRPQIVIDDLTFDKIPAKIFKGSFNDAQYLALNSNTLGTPETLTERADYYRTQRANTEKSKIKDLKKKALRENNGQLIWDLSYLPANGMTMQSLKAFKVDGQDSMENFVRLATIAQWIGKAFQIYKGLSSAHDQELLKFLLNGGYGSKSGQYFSFSALNDRLEKLYKKNVADEKSVSRNGEYTKPFQIAAYKKSDSDLDEINDLKKVADNALKDLKKSLKNLRDNNADRDTIYKVATPYFNGWANALYDWWQVLDRVPVKDSAPSLFGLGKVAHQDYFVNLDADLIPLADYILDKVDNSAYDYSRISQADAIRDYIDFEMEFDPRKKDKLVILKSRIKDVASKPRNYKPYELKMKRSRWNGWTYNQVMWGKFIEKCRPLITPENLMSDKFTVVIMDNYTNDIKNFDNIAEALDYAFVNGFLREYSFFIINDKENRIMLSEELEKDRQYIQKYLSGLHGLGKPTIKFEFEDNAALADFLSNTKKAADFADYTDVTATASIATPSGKKTAARRLSLIPSMDSGTLPATASPSPLPPSPTTPALPPYRNVFPARKRYDQAKALFPDFIIFVKDGEHYVTYDNDAQIYATMSRHDVLTDKNGDAFVSFLVSVEDLVVGEMLVDHKVALVNRAKVVTYEYDPLTHDIIIKSHLLPTNNGLGKPTIKLEFEDNDDLISLFDTDGINGLTVNDKPADIFNCPESQLQTRGYRPTYVILENYDALVDPSDGRKTLKGYGFESATLDELVNACRYYPQVAALAAHLKDPNGDPLQSAYNIWHWLHTNVRYDFDAPGQEEIRTPARAYADRNSGIDCDCLAVLTACLLINQGFHPCFEIVAFNNEPTYSHIYVNLDGAAIDRVLPVFLARPDNITKTQIMEIPVYSLSGIGGCRDTLSGVYESTLAKIQSGTATGDDNNEFRKTQVLVTLRGVNDAAYQLAALLMPYVVTVADDGTYYFDSSALANLATKLDDDLRQLIANDADPETVKQWIATAAQQIDGAASVQSNGGNDTIVVIINPQGNMTRVIGQMVKASTPTLTATTAAATDQPPAAATSSTPAIMQTSTMPGVPTDGETESDSGDWWKYALAAAAFGVGAMVGSKKKTNKRR